MKKLIASIFLIQMSLSLFSQFHREELTFSGTGDLVMSLGKMKTGNAATIKVQIQGGWAEDGGIYHIVGDYGGVPKVLYRGESSISNRLIFKGYLANPGEVYLFAEWINTSPDKSYANVVRMIVETSGTYNKTDIGDYNSAAVLSSVLTVQSNTGWVGVGTNTPADIFHIEDETPKLILDDKNTADDSEPIFYVQSSGGKAYLGMADKNTSGSLTNSTNHVVFDDGNVGIGTINVPTGYKLAVDGKAIFEEVQIKMSESWPDYVFSPNYNMLTLQETEEFIKEKGHLPNIPSAKQVEEEGIGLGDMNAKLLQKIEEQMLYIIELNKKLELVSKELELLKKKD